MKFMRKKIITGCEARGDAESPYLTRLTLIEGKFGAAYLHKFHRSDSPEQHDHPWAFVSLILWRGYIEESRNEVFLEGQTGGQFFDNKRKRVYPGMILFRPATWRHRVVLVDEKPAVTLVIRGPYRRVWGFFTANGWQNFKDYFLERGC